MTNSDNLQGEPPKSVVSYTNVWLPRSCLSKTAISMQTYMGGYLLVLCGSLALPAITIPSL